MQKTSCLESSDALSCIKNQKFSIQEVLKNPADDEWTADFTNSVDGWYFTRNAKHGLTTALDSKLKVEIMDKSKDQTHKKSLNWLAVDNM